MGKRWGGQELCDGLRGYPFQVTLEHIIHFPPSGRDDLTGSRREMTPEGTSAQPCFHCGDRWLISGSYEPTPTCCCISLELLCDLS